MCDGFNVKNTVRRIKPDLFSALLSRHSLSMSVNWKASAYKYKNDVFMNYMLMEDADHRIIEPELVEIGTFAAWAGASEAIIRSLEAQGLSLPPDYMEETVLNKAVWVYLEHPELWESLGTFASIDRVRKDRWFLADVEPYLIEAPFPDSEEPDLEMLKGELAPYIQGHQGRGKYLDIAFELRNGEDEYYIIDLNDFKRHITTCEDGEFDHEAISTKTAQIVFVYHRALKQVEALLPGFSKKEKLDLCNIWARVIKNAYIVGAEPNKPLYNLSPVLDPDFVFALDEDGYIVEAMPVGIRLCVRDCPGSRQIFLERDRSIYVQIEEAIRNHTLTRDNRIVEWLDVRVILSREFGRSRYQTVRFRPDGHNILDLNCKVHAPLLKAGNIWFPRYAA